MSEYDFMAHKPNFLMYKSSQNSELLNWHQILLLYHFDSPFPSILPFSVCFFLSFTISEYLAKPRRSITVLQFYSFTVFVFVLMKSLYGSFQNSYVLNKQEFIVLGIWWHLILVRIKYCNTIIEITLSTLI